MRGGDGVRGFLTTQARGNTENPHHFARVRSILPDTKTMRPRNSSPAVLRGTFMAVLKSTGLGVLLLVAIVSASCGGGGGGGGGSSSGGRGNSVTFTADRSSVSFTYAEGSASGQQEIVTVTAAGTLTGTLYVGALIEGQGIDPAVVASISGTSASFTLLPRSGLEAGTYTGRVRLMACSDANCNNQIGNSPININYTVTVQPTLRVTPTTIDASSPSGTATSREVAIRLPAGQTAFEASVTQGAEWLSAEPLTATSLRLNLRSLPMANYTGRVRITSGTSVATVQVNYAVTAGAAYRQLAVLPTGFTLSSTEGVANGPVSLTVTPTSWEPLYSLSILTTAPWLTLTTGTNNTHSLIVDATNLSAGSYTSSLLLTSAWPAPAITVPIALTVGPGFKRPADVVKVIHSETSAAALAGTTLVDLNQGAPTGWTATSDASWLVITDSAGTTGETLAYEIDLAGFTAFDTGREYVGNITITPQRATMTPVTYAVRVTKNLARVTAVAPYLQPAGRAVRVILRGSGFDSVTNLGSRLRVDNGSGAIASVERVNDTELVLRLNPLSAGAHPVTINNALGLTTGTQTLKTFTPTVLNYSTAPTGGVPRGLVWDQERQAALLMNVTLESLQQYKFASGWSVNSVAVPSIHSAGLTLDGSRLIVASNPGSTVYGDGTSYIRQLDPDTLAQISVKDVPQMGNGFTYIMGELQTTNDGRTWFSLGSGQWNGLAYYEASKDALTEMQVTHIPTTFHGGPWFAVSRDGERLLMPQSGSISSNPPALYLDARDGVLHINAGGIQNSYRMSLSEDGDRVLYDNDSVRDRDFALIGRVILPSSHNYYQMYGGGVVSPDGRRIYQLAYINNYGPWNPALPRVYVLDATTRQTTQPGLPVLGYFEVADYAHCTNYNDYSCTLVVQTAISPDGNNLFFAGNEKLIAVPIPAESALTPIMKAQRTPGFVTTPWPLNLGANRAN